MISLRRRTSPCRRRHIDVGGRLEFLATVVMAAAAILTAWTAFQSTKWSGVQAVAFSDANAARVESTRASTRAGQEMTVDVVSFLAWLEALHSDVRSEPKTVAELDASGYNPDPDTVSGFLFERFFRDEFQPAVRAWAGERPPHDEDAAPTPFAMEEYALESQREADTQLRRAEHWAANARQANQRSDNYVLTTVAFAMAIFFAGVSTKLIQEQNRLRALVMAMGILVGTGAAVATFPVQI